MSSRAMRKLEEAMRKEKQQAGEEEESFLEDERESRKKSVFALVVSSDEEGGEEENNDHEGKQQEQVKQPQPSVGGGPTKTKKKKKKKKNTPIVEKNAQESADDDDDAVLLEKFKEENDALKAMENITLDHVEKNKPSPLAIELTNLNPDDEVIRVLGKSVQHFAEDGASSSAELPAGIPRRMRGRYLASLQAGGNKTIMKSFFVRPEKAWRPVPTYVSGVGARMIEVKKNGSTFYSFEASDAYLAAQRHFKAMVATFDPNNLMNVLQQFPYHVDTLLQLHDVHVMRNQNEMANSLLRVALYALEIWIGSTVRKKMEKGNQVTLLLPESDLVGEKFLKLDGGIDAGLNGALIRALNIQMKAAGRRECFTSAFSLCKLFFGLERELDPCYARLCIDYYALKNEKHQWLVDNFAALSLLPSFFCNVAFSLCLAWKRLGNTGEALSCLVRACFLFPSYLKRHELLVSLYDEDVISKFLNVECWREEDERVIKLIKIASVRQASLWDAEKVDWVKKTLKEYLLKEKGKPAREEIHSMRDAREKERASTYWNVCMSYYSQAVAFDFSDSVAFIPQEEEEERREAPRERANDGARQRERPANRQENVLDLNANPLMLFMQTLVPWNILPTRENEEEGLDE